MQIMQAQIGQLNFEMQAVQGQLFEWSQSEFDGCAGGIVELCDPDVPVPAKANSGITSTQPPAGSISTCSANEWQPRLAPLATTAETSVS